MANFEEGTAASRATAGAPDLAALAAGSRVVATVEQILKHGFLCSLSAPGGLLAKGFVPIRDAPEDFRTGDAIRCTVQGMNPRFKTYVLRPENGFLKTSPAPGSLPARAGKHGGTGAPTTPVRGRGYEPSPGVRERILEVPPLLGENPSFPGLIKALARVFFRRGRSGSR